MDIRGTKHARGSMNSRGIGHAPEERQNDAQNGLKRAIGQLKQALASIDKQAPGAYLPRLRMLERVEHHRVFWVVLAA